MTGKLIAMAGLGALALLTGCKPEQTAPEADARPSRAARVPPGYEQIPLSQAGEDALTSEVPAGGEISGERATQRSLPMVRGGVWDTLRTTRISIDQSSQLYVAIHSEAVRPLAGRPVTLRGYMLPLEASERTARFLISPYTPVCFFHPPAEPNEVVEVRLTRPIEAGYHLVEVTGPLRLESNGEKGLFFVIDGGRARIVERVVE